MITVSSTTLAAAIGGLALSLGAGVASADPDLAPVVNTTCNYDQVVHAMNDQSPSTAAQFNSSPAAQTWLQNFLSAPPAQRQDLMQEAQASPVGAQYVGLFVPLANTCSRY